MNHGELVHTFLRELDAGIPLQEAVQNLSLSLGMVPGNKLPPTSEETISSTPGQPNVSSIAHKLKHLMTSNRLYTPADLIQDTQTPPALCRGRDQAPPGKGKRHKFDDTSDTITFTMNHIASPAEHNLADLGDAGSNETGFHSNSSLTVETTSDSLPYGSHYRAQLTKEDYDRLATQAPMSPVYDPSVTLPPHETDPWMRIDPASYTQFNFSSGDDPNRIDQYRDDDDPGYRIRVLWEPELVAEMEARVKGDSEIRDVAYFPLFNVYKSKLYATRFLPPFGSATPTSPSLAPVNSTGSGDAPGECGSVIERPPTPPRSYFPSAGLTATPSQHGTTSHGGNSTMSAKNNVSDDELLSAVTVSPPRHSRRDHHIERETIAESLSPKKSGEEVVNVPPHRRSSSPVFGSTIPQAKGQPTVTSPSFGPDIAENAALLVDCPSSTAWEREYGDVQKIRRRQRRQKRKVRYPVSEDSCYPTRGDNDAVIGKQFYNAFVVDSFNLKVVFERNRTGFSSLTNSSSRFDYDTLIGGRYRVVSMIGQAAFSCVYQCVDELLKRDVSVKVIKDDKDFIDQSLDEIQLLRYISTNAGDINARRCLKLLDYLYYNERLFIVTELLGENLYVFSQRMRRCGCGSYFSLGCIQKIAHQLLIGIDYIHSIGLIHCDLKPENILIQDETIPLIKIIDFGSSLYVSDAGGAESTEDSTTGGGAYVQSRSYRSPEIILGLNYDQKIDLWSIGCILFELWTNYVLFQNDSIQSLVARVAGIIGPIPYYMVSKSKQAKHLFTRDGQLFIRLQDPAGPSANEWARRKVRVLLPKKTSLRQRLRCCDELFVDFMSKLIVIDPSERMSAKEALAHPWMRPVPVWPTTVLIHETIVPLQLWGGETETKIKEFDADLSRFEADSSLFPAMCEATQVKMSVKHLVAAVVEKADNSLYLVQPTTPKIMESWETFLKPSDHELRPHIKVFDSNALVWIMTLLRRMLIWRQDLVQGKKLSKLASHVAENMFLQAIHPTKCRISDQELESLRNKGIMEYATREIADLKVLSFPYVCDSGLPVGLLPARGKSYFWDFASSDNPWNEEAIYRRYLSRCHLDSTADSLGNTTEQTDRIIGAGEILYVWRQEFSALYKHLFENASVIQEFADHTNALFQGSPNTRAVREYASIIANALHAFDRTPETTSSVAVWTQTVGEAAPSTRNVPTNLLDPTTGLVNVPLSDQAASAISRAWPDQQNKPSEDDVRQLLGMAIQKPQILLEFISLDGYKFRGKAMKEMWTIMGAAVCEAVYFREKREGRSTAHLWCSDEIAPQSGSAGSRGLYHNGQYTNLIEQVHSEYHGHVNTDDMYQGMESRCEKLRKELEQLPQDERLAELTLPLVEKYTFLEGAVGTSKSRIKGIKESCGFINGLAQTFKEAAADPAKISDREVAAYESMGQYAWVSKMTEYQELMAAFRQHKNQSDVLETMKRIVDSAGPIQYPQLNELRSLSYQIGNPETGTELIREYIEKFYKMKQETLKQFSDSGAKLVSPDVKKRFASMLGDENLDRSMTWDTLRRAVHMVGQTPKPPPPVTCDTNVNTLARYPVQTDTDTVDSLLQDLTVPEEYATDIKKVRANLEETRKLWQAYSTVQKSVASRPQRYTADTWSKWYDLAQDLLTHQGVELEADCTPIDEFRNGLEQMLDGLANDDAKLVRVYQMFKTYDPANQLSQELRDFSALEGYPNSMSLLDLAQALLTDFSNAADDNQRMDLYDRAKRIHGYCLQDNVPTPPSILEVIRQFDQLSHTQEYMRDLQALEDEIELLSLDIKYKPKIKTPIHNEVDYREKFTKLEELKGKAAVALAQMEQVLSAGPNTADLGSILSKLENLASLSPAQWNLRKLADLVRCADGRNPHDCLAILDEIKGLDFLDDGSITQIRSCMSSLIQNKEITPSDLKLLERNLFYGWANDLSSTHFSKLTQSQDGKVHCLSRGEEDENCVSMLAEYLDQRRPVGVFHSGLPDNPFEESQSVFDLREWRSKMAGNVQMQLRDDSDDVNAALARLPALARLLAFTDSLQFTSNKSADLSVLEYKGLRQRLAHAEFGDVGTALAEANKALKKLAEMEKCPSDIESRLSYITKITEESRWDDANEDAKSAMALFNELIKFKVCTFRYANEKGKLNGSKNVNELQVIRSTAVTKCGTGPDYVEPKVCLDDLYNYWLYQNKEEFQNWRHAVELELLAHSPASVLSDDNMQVLLNHPEYRIAAEIKNQQKTLIQNKQFDETAAKHITTSILQWQEKRKDVVADLRDESPWCKEVSSLLGEYLDQLGVCEKLLKSFDPQLANPDPQLKDDLISLLRANNCPPSFENLQNEINDLRSKGYDVLRKSQIYLAKDGVTNVCPNDVPLTTIVADAQRLHAGIDTVASLATQIDIAPLVNTITTRLMAATRCLQFRVLESPVQEKQLADEVKTVDDALANLEKANLIDEWGRALVDSIQGTKLTTAELDNLTSILRGGPQADSWRPTEVISVRNLGVDHLALMANLVSNSNSIRGWLHAAVENAVRIARSRHSLNVSNLTWDVLKAEFADEPAVEAGVKYEGALSQFLTSRCDAAQVGFSEELKKEVTQLTAMVTSMPKFKRPEGAAIDLLPYLSEINTKFKHCLEKALYEKPITIENGQSSWSRDKPFVEKAIGAAFNTNYSVFSSPLFNTVASSFNKRVLKDDAEFKKLLTNIHGAKDAGQAQKIWHDLIRYASAQDDKPSDQLQLNNLKEGNILDIASTAHHFAPGLEGFDLDEGLRTISKWRISEAEVAESVQWDLPLDGLDKYPHLQTIIQDILRLRECRSMSDMTSDRINKLVESPIHHVGIADLFARCLTDRLWNVNIDHLKEKLSFFARLSPELDNVIQGSSTQSEIHYRNLKELFTSSRELQIAVNRDLKAEQLYKKLEKAKEHKCSKSLSELMKTPLNDLATWFNCVVLLHQVSEAPKFPFNHRRMLSTKYSKELVSLPDPVTDPALLIDYWKSVTVFSTGALAMDLAYQILNDRGKTWREKAQDIEALESSEVEVQRILALVQRIDKETQSCSDDTTQLLDELSKEQRLSGDIIKIVTNQLVELCWEAFANSPLDSQFPSRYASVHELASRSDDGLKHLSNLIQKVMPARIHQRIDTLKGELNQIAMGDVKGELTLMDIADNIGIRFKADDPFVEPTKVDVQRSLNEEVDALDNIHTPMPKSLLSSVAHLVKSLGMLENAQLGSSPLGEQLRSHLAPLHLHRSDAVYSNILAALMDHTLNPSALQGGEHLGRLADHLTVILKSCDQESPLTDLIQRMRNTIPPILQELSSAKNWLGKLDKRILEKWASCAIRRLIKSPVSADKHDRLSYSTTAAEIEGHGKSLDVAFGTDTITAKFDDFWTVYEQKWAPLSTKWHSFTEDSKNYKVLQTAIDNACQKAQESNVSIVQLAKQLTVSSSMDIDAIVCASAFDQENSAWVRRLAAPWVFQLSDPFAHLGPIADGFCEGKGTITDLVAWIKEYKAAGIRVPESIQHRAIECLVVGYVTIPLDLRQTNDLLLLEQDLVELGGESKLKNEIDRIINAAAAVIESGKRPDKCEPDIIWRKLAEHSAKCIEEMDGRLLLGQLRSLQIREEDVLNDLLRLDTADETEIQNKIIPQVSVQQSKYHALAEKDPSNLEVYDLFVQGFEECLDMLVDRRRLTLKKVILLPLETEGELSSPETSETDPWISLMKRPVVPRAESFRERVIARLKYLDNKK